ncbi:hypothetical protein VII00023_11866 [Vibrio ichthyoenteri ATCC 700023]|uniref:Uncharacterized protein n=1 Tax=Vibrio ichthyoenteri ATCC 700023 TaxID=870968 RepID=F9RYS4_9VIBR|nr:hypothetical protein [Vibrio ichthyoenteri]EGU46284.1 hypothetical protein VII00023_11866 [Vibrio ichthyoenteri ATCC 700023]
MGKTVSVVAVLFLVMGYFSYQYWVVKPQHVEQQAKSMVLQIAYGEQWFNPLKHSDENPIYHTTLEVNSSYDGVAYADAKIEYVDDQKTLCKTIRFQFAIDSLNDYHLLSQSDCAMGSSEKSG